MQFTLKSFQQLSIEELYEIMRLRQAVFVVEQDCVYLDADDKDQASLHLMGIENDQLLAYARLMPHGLSYEGYPSIGRIITSEVGRGKGYGKLLVTKAIECCHQQWGKTAIKIGAQTYLLKFYQNFGFEVIGEEYLEDGIPHIHMVLPVK